MIYHCYFGHAEQYKYTFKARNLRHLRTILNKELMWLSKDTRWYRQVTPEGYPKGSIHFILKDSKRHAPLFKTMTPLLVIEEQDDRD